MILKEKDELEIKVKLKLKPIYFLYILECKNNNFYTGIAVDPDKRYREHCQGKAAKYTRAFPPKNMVAIWKINGDRSLAQKIEYQVKLLTRLQKEKIIQQPLILKKILKEHGELIEVKLSIG